MNYVWTPPKELVFFVEGHGDEEAIPALVCRVASLEYPNCVVSFPHQARVSKGELLNEVKFLRLIGRARYFIPSGGSVLVVMDADTDCPREINRLLLGWATKHHSDLRVSVVVAKREMEAWFVAGAESLRDGLGCHSDAEDCPDPKAWVGRHVLEAYYTPTADQARLARRLDPNLAKCIQSYDKFYRDVVRLLA
jgi:Domain of unknown function (DUF4276)